MKKSLLLCGFLFLMGCTQEVANRDNENDHSILMQQITPPPLPPTTGFKDVFVGNGRACALRTDGTPVFWGQDFSGGRKVEHALANIKFKKIIVQDYDIIGLDLDGKIRALFDNKIFFESINDAGPFVDFAVAYGAMNIVAVKADGSLVHKFSSRSAWDVSKLPEKVKLAVAGNNEICFLTMDNGISCIGDSSRQSSLPAGHFDRLSVSSYLCARKINDGTIECAGKFFSDYPKDVSLKIDGKVHDIVTGIQEVCVIKANNQPACFNLETNTENGRLMMAPPRTLDFVYKLSVGINEACAIQNIDGDGTIVCWGDKNSPIVNEAPRPR